MGDGFFGFDDAFKKIDQSGCMMIKRKQAPLFPYIFPDSRHLPAVVEQCCQIIYGIEEKTNVQFAQQCFRSYQVRAVAFLQHGQTCSSKGSHARRVIEIVPGTARKLTLVVAVEYM